MLAAMAAGASLLLGPAVLKTRFGVDEVVTTLLLNFIVLLFVSMLLEGPLKDPMGLGWPQSPKVIAEAQLPRIIQGKRLHYGFVIAIVSAVIVWVIMKKTVLGYEMRAVGHNPQAARFAGIPVNRVLMKTALLSGGLAALAGFSRSLGPQGQSHASICRRATAIRASSSPCSPCSTRSASSRRRSSSPASSSAPTP